MVARTILNPSIVLQIFTICLGIILYIWFIWFNDRLSNGGGEAEEKWKEMQGSLEERGVFYPEEKKQSRRAWSGVWKHDEGRGLCRPYEWVCVDTTRNIIVEREELIIKLRTYLLMLREVSVLFYFCFLSLHAWSKLFHTKTKKEILMWEAKDELVRRET